MFDPPASLRRLRVAIVHDYLNQPGGAESVVRVFSRMFPGAPVYTSVYDPGRMPAEWRDVDIRTTYLQRLTPRLPLARAMMPLYPSAFESLDLRGFDLVLSSTTAFAKGVITRPETFHICYCNNPTRFLWMSHEYLAHESLPRPVRAAVAGMLGPMRLWDFAAAQRVDSFVAGSRNAGRRIAKYYRRSSDVVPAPIEVDRFQPSSERAGFFLVVSRLQSYKRIDLAVQACTRLKLPLHVVGDGPDARRLRSLAGPTVSFFGRIPDEELRHQMATCRALIFPGEEDFGLTPLEAQASGRPVIAYAAGGALETVVDGETGLFFHEQTVDSLCRILEPFEDRFDAAALRANARRFDTSVFVERMYDVIERRYEEYTSSMAAIR